MSKQSIEASAHMEGTPQSESIGVIGIDGKEHPIPTQEQLDMEYLKTGTRYR